MKLIIQQINNIFRKVLLILKMMNISIKKKIMQQFHQILKKIQIHYNNKIL